MLLRYWISRVVNELSKFILKLLLFINLLVLLFLIAGPTLVFCALGVALITGFDFYLAWGLLTPLGLLALIPISRGLARINPASVGKGYGMVQVVNNLAFALCAGLIIAFCNILSVDNYPISRMVLTISVAILIWGLQKKIRSVIYAKNVTCLYLRRFGSESEYSFLPALIRSLPSDVSVQMLVEQKTMLRAWDFITTCFVPLFSLRVDSVCYLQGSDDEWEVNVKKIVGNVDFVVMDISELSSSIYTELSMLSKYIDNDKLIWLSTQPVGECLTILGAYNISPTHDKILSASRLERRISTDRIIMYLGFQWFTLVLCNAIYINDLGGKIDNITLLIELVISLYVSIVIAGRHSLVKHAEIELVAQLNSHIRLMAKS